MLVTSMGIFGFLSKGYLDVKHPATQQEIQIQSANNDITLIRERMDAIDYENEAYRLELDQMRAVIESYPKNYVTKKLNAYKEQAPRRDAINKGLEENRDLKGKQLLLLRDKNINLSDLEKERVEIEGDLGPIKYVAQALGVSVDDGVKYVILAIIFVFDPLAVLLILAANISIARRFGKGKSALDSVLHVLAEKETPEPAPVIEEAPVIVPETPVAQVSVAKLPKTTKTHRGSSLSPKNRRS
jgi:regulator of replication initiation timing